MNPQISAESPDFPGDSTPQPPFGFRDSLRSAALWSVGLPHLGAWLAAIKIGCRFYSPQQIDFLFLAMSRALPALSQLKVKTLGAEEIDKKGTYVFVSNHVNIFDMWVLYQSIPVFNRSLEHIDHFSWPVIGPLITAAGQIPVDPDNPRRTAAGLRQAVSLLKAGRSVTVLPEGSRTLDGSVGTFFPGAFRIALRAQVPVVPIAIKGGRAINRRGDWRMKPGTEEVIFGAPVPVEGLGIRDAPRLAGQCRNIVIELLKGQRSPGS
jgi:1-acyl-sn-glycerol-3-phosphate acyltransferase